MTDREISLSDVGAFVPFPAALLDETMPSLKDTEWRLLCVIVRQTLGWKAGKGRKRSDWMTQRQLMARTGRNSAALSAALNALVRKNLVECRDAGGAALTTPQQRRRHRGRVYFALARRLVDTENIPKSKRSPSSRGQVAARVYSGWTNAGAVLRTEYPRKPEGRLP